MAALLSAGLVKAVDFERGVPADVMAQVKADLGMVETITAKQKSPLHASEFGSVDGKGYMAWFNERVENFGYDADDHSGAIAYNDSMWNPNHMMVTDYFVKGNLPQAARVMVLFHEARHSEGSKGYWMHSTCPSPYIGDDGKEVKSIFSGLPVSGKAACDRGVAGAYGVSTTMLSNIGRFCENCSEKLKMDADLYAKDQVSRLPARADREKMRQDFTQIAAQ